VADVQGSFATSAIPGTRFTEIRWIAETGSTNADLLSEARSGAAEGLVIVADHQHSGRGRLDRTWVAPPGSSLLVSVLLRNHLDATTLFLLPAAAGVASAEACEEVGRATTGLKWPNDLVAIGGEYADRKLSGVLAESVVSDGRIDAVVVGMGLNVNWPADLPADLESSATALNLLVGDVIDREQLLIAWLRRFDHWLTVLSGGSGPALLLDAVRARSATIGRSVRIEFTDHAVEGTATSIDEDGRVLVVPFDGSPELTVSVGDVVHLRPIR
jgi:BirA family biotin operon repressor/biotin-[acetyl-CoA-carboxylase] ligase